ncbi:MAG: hypothetical protein QXF52_02150 [Thermoproteota archaeon]
MKATPLCSDSMGVRSMATLVETPDIRLIIDPAAAVAPLRYGLPPHPKELNLLEECWRRIVSAAEECEIVAVTHYHYDHHSSTRFLEEIYKGRIVMVKDPENLINFSQKNRAKTFLEKIKPIAAQVVTADGREHVFGETKISFSHPVPHGADSYLGYVLETFVNDYSDSFLFTSDVQGFPLDYQVKFVLEKKPKTIFIDGPSTYMLGLNYTMEELEASLRNMGRIIKETRPLKIILDHHLLRDLEWKKHFEKLFEEAEKLGVVLETAAEYIGMEANLLEALRGALYGLRGR